MSNCVLITFYLVLATDEIQSTITTMVACVTHTKQSTDLCMIMYVYLSLINQLLLSFSDNSY